MKPILISIFSIFLSVYIYGQDKLVEKNILAGNEYYEKQEFDKAEEKYRAALGSDPQNSTAKFNLANTLYKLHKEKEAISLYTGLSTGTRDTRLVTTTFYNKGVSQSRLHELEESINSYKEVLRKDPEDKEARENLQKALLELKKKNTPPKKEPENKKNPQPPKTQSKLNPKEVDRRLKQLQQKEKEVQQRLQKEKSKTGGGNDKDW
ncbi:MAG TPA: tetratricopeptide repeat protein [Chitinophagaceae bacterium]|nr:tetratricopeptide repeat protein [Chitinophagaceae bacterium]